MMFLIYSPNIVIREHNRCDKMRSYIYARSHNREKRLLPSSRPSVRPSVCPQVLTRLPLGFTRK